MANGDFEIDEEMWSELSTDRKLWLIFSEFNQQRKECHAEFCRIKKELSEKAVQTELTGLAKSFDRRKKIDTSCAGMMGFVGGVAGFIGSKLFGVIK